MSRNTRPDMGEVPLPWPADPPLEPLRETLAKAGCVMVRGPLRLPGTPQAVLHRFVTSTQTDWHERPIGTPERVVLAYDNAEITAATIQQHDRERERRGLPQNRRANDAGVNVVAACRVMNAALMMHLQAELWHENATLTLLRTALELAARGGFIALGTGNEPSRWSFGPDHPVPKVRKAAAALFGNRRDTCDRIASTLRARESSASHPYTVFQWLCGFTHLDNDAIGMNVIGSKRPITHDLAYAAFAYVAWVCAVMGEVVTGLPDLARWPDAWPDPLPWG